MTTKPQLQYSPDDKLRWEVEKLKAETQNLKRAWINNPASWLTIITTIVALSGVAIQYIKSDTEYKLVQIKIEQAKLEGTRVANENSKLLLIRQQLQNQVKLAQNELTKLKNEPGTVNQSSKQLQETEDTFNTLSAALKSDDTLTQFVSVIATLRTSDLAIRRAKGLTSKGIRYPVEVYQKAPGQYTLTLGGKLTYLDASRRVEYAKQNGFPDAIVRLAKNWGNSLVN